MKKKCSVLFVISVLVFFAISLTTLAEATLVSYEFSGKLTWLREYTKANNLSLDKVQSNWVPGVTFKEGDSFNGFIEYDTSAIVSSVSYYPPNGTNAIYSNALTKMWINIGGFQHTSISPGYIGVANNKYGSDNFFFSSERRYNDIYFDVSGILIDHTQSALTGYTIPLNINFSEYDSNLVHPAFVFQNGDQLHLYMNIENFSNVPELACTYSLSPDANGFTATSALGVVNVTPSTSSCSWTATSNNSWITVTSGSSGTGSGTVSYSIAANTTGSTRIGTMTIGGKTFTVTQTRSSGKVGLPWLLLLLGN